MSRGRPPKPVEAKILTGTFREDRHGKPEEAVKTTGAPVRPPLTGDALALWDAVVPGMAERGIAGAPDSAMLQAMCECWGRYRRAAGALEKLKDLSTSKAKALSIRATEALGSFTLIACRFGLTPADRARLRVEPPKKAGVASRRRA